MRQLAIVLLLLPVACGKGSSFDKGFRDSYRTKFVESCVTSANQAALRAGNGAAGGDFQRVCGCAADKLLATKTVSELMSGPSESDQMAVMQACVASGGAAPTTQPGAPPPARPKGLHDI